MKQMFLSVRPDEQRLAVTENGRLIDFAEERTDRPLLVGRVYKGIVKNVVPAVKGRFIDIGIGRNGFLRNEDCIDRAHLPTEGSAVVVQVVKDSTDTKGPLVTEKVSLPGRYAALLTDTDYIGISKKIRSEAQREALRAAAKACCPEGLGLVIRTAAGKAGTEDVGEDIRRLAGLWASIQKRAKLEKGASLLYRNSELPVRTVRDFLTDEVERITTDSRDTYDRLVSLVEDEKLGSAGRICYEEGPLFKNHHLEEQVARLFDREVELPGGGSIVIDYTEALTAIDVNSGSFHRKGIPHEEAAYLVNREAALEIAAQIRMRGIGGMILIDFIDMEEPLHNEGLLSLLRRETAKDRVRTVVLGMTALGLVEMTRKRTAQRLVKSNYDCCPLCHGTGYVLAVGTIVSRIFRALEEEKARGGIPRPLVIECHPDVASVLETEDCQFRMKSLMLRPIRVEGRPGIAREVFSILADNGFEA